MSLSPETHQSPSSGDIEARLQHVGRYSRFVAASLSIILLAFALALFVVLP
ncbi:hypothetical protein [Halobacterium rubrum]|uniref:hypothetical protein n=1 Tax=Halobacterium TaxID=2239 RepID=UPI001F23EBF3|nr:MULTISPECIES: hypothetical protein [Halobacterium]MDH5021444.1 hypothetical protein [Halobacterium rubrum]